MKAVTIRGEQRHTVTMKLLTCETSHAKLDQSRIVQVKEGQQATQMNYVIRVNVHGSVADHEF